MAKKETPDVVYAFSDMQNDIPDAYKATASALDALAARYELKAELSFAPKENKWKCVYTLKKPRKKLFTVWVSPGEFRVKANLWNIDSYLSAYNLTDAIKAQMLNNAYDCASCVTNRCNGVKFTLDGQARHKCIFGAFTFVNMDATDYGRVVELIEREIEEIK